MARVAPTVQGSLWSINKAAKLSGEANFVSWKSMVQPILKVCGCWPFITGRRVCPAFPPLALGALFFLDAQHEPTLDQDAWDVKDQHDYAILSNSLYSKVAIQFSSNNTAKELWEAIHLHYEWASNQRLIRLQI